MKKQFIFYSLILLVLIGCRSESMVETEEFHQKSAKKIVFFEDYTKTNYNPIIPFIQSTKAYLTIKPETKKQIEEKYGMLDFESSSDIFTNEKTGTLSVFFPIIKENKISTFLKVSVNKQLTEINFSFSALNENTISILENEHISKMSDDPDNRNRGVREGYIEEVIITRPSPRHYYEKTIEDPFDGRGEGSGDSFNGNDFRRGHDEGYGGGSSSNPTELTQKEKEELELLTKYYTARMSDEEKKIFSELKGYQKLNYLRSALYAYTSAENKFPNSLYNGKGDAYRHAIFSARTSKLIGKDLSYQLLTAHEQEPNQHPLEKAMDLYNNNVGRNIPMSLSIWDFDIYIEKLANEGKLMIISDLGADGKPTANSKLIPSNK